MQGRLYGPKHGSLNTGAENTWAVDPAVAAGHGRGPQRGGVEHIPRLACTRVNPHQRHFPTFNQNQANTLTLPPRLSVTLAMSTKVAQNQEIVNKTSKLSAWATLGLDQHT